MKDTISESSTRAKQNEFGSFTNKASGNHKNPEQRCMQRGWTTRARLNDVGLSTVEQCELKEVFFSVPVPVSSARCQSWPLHDSCSEGEGRCAEGPSRGPGISRSLVHFMEWQVTPQDLAGGEQECVYPGIACHCQMHQAGVATVHWASYTPPCFAPSRAAVYCFCYQLDWMPAII